MVVSSLTQDVTRSLIKKSAGGFVGPRIRLKALVTSDLVKCRDIIQDDEVANTLASNGGKYNAKMFKQRYSYYELLMRMSGHSNEVCEVDDESDIVDDESEDSVDTEDIVSTSSVKSAKKSSKKPREYIGTIYDDRINADVICKYFRDKQSDGSKKILEFVRTYGIDNTIEAIEKLVGNDSYNLISARSPYIRTMGLIKFCIDRTSMDDSLKILRNYVKDGKAESFEKNTLFKGIKNIFAGKNGELIEEYTISYMCDTLIKCFDPHEFTEFFTDIRYGRNLFSFLHLSADTMSVLGTYKSLNVDEFINNALVTVQDTFSNEDVKQQLKDYAVDNLEKQYKNEGNFLIYQHVTKNSSEAIFLKEYYRAITDKRFIHADSDPVNVDDINAQIKEITSESAYKGCQCFVVYRDDFVERTKFKDMTFREFLLTIIDEKLKSSDKVERYVICQSDSVPLGGLTLYATEKDNTVEASFWIFPEYGHIRLSKETLYILVNSLKDCINVTDIRFRVHNNNKIMQRSLDKTGAIKSEYLSTGDYSVYEFNIFDASRKSFEDFIGKEVYV